MSVNAITTPALWILRSITGVRIYHVLATCLLLVGALAALALPFWWLGAHAESAIGPVGAIVVTGTYLASATVLLGVSAVLLWRLLVARIRRTFALLQPRP